MTQSPNTTRLTHAQVMAELELSPEEQAHLEQYHPLFFAHKKSVEEDPKSLAKYVALSIVHSMRTLGFEEDARRTAERQKEEVAQIEKMPEQTSLLSFLGYIPRDMTRVSPFFPMSLQEQHSEREYLQDLVISSGKWGHVKYSGPKLSTFDEDIFIVLQGYLHLVNSKGLQAKLHTTEDGRSITIYDYRGSALPFLKMLGYDKPNKRDYDRLKESARRLVRAVVEFELSAGTTKKGKPRIKKTMATPMFSLFGWNEEKKELVISFNPYFYEMYIVGSPATTIDLAVRMSLKSPIAKALHRFIVGQQNLDGRIPFGYKTLANIANMNTAQPDWKIRQNIKSALKELIEKKVLANNPKTDPFLTGKEKENVRLIRAKKAPQKIGS